MNTRDKKILHKIAMLKRTIVGLELLMVHPNSAVDLSEIAIGALTILSETCEVRLLHSGDNVFGIMNLDDEDLGRTGDQ